jgi:hypothetical protein
MVKPLLEELIDMVEEDVKSAIKEIKYFIENPKNKKK